MLRLLTAPHWTSHDGVHHELPATLPAALLIYLAAQRGAWVSRDSLAALWWPERSPTEALHALRLTLHRLKQLLATWAVPQGIEAERQRVRLGLPCDLQALHDGIEGNDAAALIARPPWAWLQGFALTRADPFRAWADAEGAHWQSRWRAAAERALVRALQGGQPEQAWALAQAWQAGGTALPAALASLDLALLPVASRLAAQALRAGRVGPPAPVLAAQALAGRGAELAALLRVQSPAHVTYGEAGIGKSSLLAAAFPGTPLLQGREGLDGVPYAPVLEALRQPAMRLVERLAEGDASLAPYRLDLARLMPELAPHEPLPALDALTAKARLVEALSRVFDAAGPLLRVDDLQWCDAATLEWLVMLAHRGRLRWRGAARPHELGSPARQALASLQAARLIEQSTLDALSPQALTQVCLQRWPGQAWSEARCAELHAASGGNAFLLAELVDTDDSGTLDAARPALARAVALLRKRLLALPPLAQRAVEASAVLGQPAPAALLGRMVEAGDAADWVLACEQAWQAALLIDLDGLLRCRHDLVRSAVLSSLSAPRRQWLHRRAALALADGSLRADPLLLAAHWQAAQEPQTALGWLHEGAQAQMTLGRFAEARALWQQVCDEAVDAALALRARLALAECSLYDDLAAGRSGLESVLEQLGQVADAGQRNQIEARALAGLIDNAVFGGDLPRAQTLARRLRPLLPRLTPTERVHGCEVLIELAMREPDIDGALALLAQAQRLQPDRPALLSYEAQIHWFGGNVRAARDAFETLLLRHPEHCQGLTIENDLAVMLHALGELDLAEQMARRSLASWQGVAHTETLSLLVLGSVLTSAGRAAEAEAALSRAQSLARAQSSALFESEALVRRARLALQQGRHEQAQPLLDAAGPLLSGSDEPLRVSQFGLLRLLSRQAAGLAPDPGLIERLQAIGLRSVHPVVHVRLARAECALAWARGDAAAAVAAARRQGEIARQAGLLEPLAEALLLEVRAGRAVGIDWPALLPPLHQAAALAQAQGLADLHWRACAWLAAATGSAERRRNQQAACSLLVQGGGEPRFDAARAGLAEPRLP